MKNFLIEKLLIELFQENIHKKNKDYKSLEKYKRAFITADKFYQNLSDLDKYRKYL